MADNHFQNQGLSCCQSLLSTMRWSCSETLPAPYDWIPLTVAAETAGGSTGSFGNSPASCVTSQEPHVLLPQHLIHCWSNSFMEESSEAYSLQQEISLEGLLNIDPSSSEPKVMNNNSSILFPSGFSLLDSLLGFEERSDQCQQESSGELQAVPERNFSSRNSSAFGNGSSEFHSLIKPHQFMAVEESMFNKPPTKFNSEISASPSACLSASKKPRIQSPTPLPTFKVRKEKLGDRITALQQLVSPFGKTDTASVLYEAIEYIKFLHDQVQTLSSPYLSNQCAGFNHQMNMERPKDEEGREQQLRSRGLCLVPISSKFAVACNAIPPTDYLTPFGLSFI